MKVKEESEKVALKLNIQKTKIMASGPITSWEIEGETVETVSDFIFLGSKITADGDCSHEIKRRLLLGSGLPFPSPVDHVLSELSTMACPSWVGFHGMFHSFTELDKAVVHVVSLISFL